MKKINLCLIWVIIFYQFIIPRSILEAESKPSKPKVVHNNAVWDDDINCWIYKENNGNISLWLKDGTIRSKTYMLNPYTRIEVRYHKNGNISKKGQERFFTNLDDEDGSTGWFGIGKWKEFYESGKIKREYCYTPVKSEYVYWTSAKCGTEIIYNEDGTIQKKVEHKIKCKYGCEELNVNK